MKNTFSIFLSDLKKLVRSPLALAIAIGLCFLPSLYAWFNIFSNWDPYSNTGNIKIAVFSDDEGYILSDGTYKNMGDDVLKELEESSSIDWTFVKSADELTDGVESGKYYAGLMIEHDFTEKMYTVFDSDFAHPSIKYYENEKKNAIATKITDTAVGTLQTSINKKFIETVASTIFENTNSVSSGIDDREKVTTLRDKLGSLRDNLITYSETIAALNDGNELLLNTLEESGENIAELSLDISIASANFKNAQTSFSAARTSLNSFSIQLTNTLDGITLSLNKISNDLSSATLASDTQNAVNSLSKVSADTAVILTQLRILKNMLADNILSGSVSTGNNGGDGTIIPSERPSIEIPAELPNLESAYITITVIEASVTQISNAVAVLAQQSAGNGVLTESMINNAISEITDVLESCSKQINDLKNTYNNSLAPQLTNLNDSIEQMLSNVNDITSSLESALNDAGLIITGVENTVGDATDSLVQVQEVLYRVIEKLDNVINWMDTADDSEKITMVTQFLGGDPETYGEFFGEPVNVVTEAVYPVDTYGSAVTPFYTILALWVGGTVLVSLIKVHAQPVGLTGVKSYHLFFGRYLMFFVLGQLQAAIVVWGDIHLLHCQVLNPFLFWVVASIASFTFTLLIFSLTISFGDIGKAIAVIVMILQIAGSSGTFPIELLPQVYQKIYIFFPFPYAINAMRETVAGMYEATYITNLLELLIFAVAALVIGLVIRIPFVKLNHFVEKRMEDTKMM